MNIEWLKNKTKEKFYPITHAKAVLFGENNRTVNDELATLEKGVAELKNDLVNKELPVGSVVMIFAESATPVFAYGTWNKMNTEPYSFDTSSGGASSRIAVYFYRRIS